MERWLQVQNSPPLVAGARRFVCGALRAWGLPHVIDDAELVVSELITNAIVHTDGWTALRVCADDSHVVRIEVYDSNPRVPVAEALARGATGGRGLHLVSAVASAWGTELRDRGKIVWAELRDAKN